MDEELYKLAAIHEAGHLLVAHWLGLRINFVELKTSVPGEGICSISWKEDQQTVNILTKSILHDERKSLKKINQDYLKELSIKFIQLFCSGTAAEAAFDIHFSGKTSITSINAMDNDQIADFVDALKGIGVEIPDEEVSKQFNLILKLLSNEKYLTSIVKLADTILKKEDHKLNAEELNEYFQKNIV